MFAAATMETLRTAPAVQESATGLFAQVLSGVSPMGWTIPSNLDGAAEPGSEGD